MNKIEVTLRPSRLFIGLLVGVVIGSLGMVSFVALGWLLKILMMTAVLGYGVWILRSSRSILGLELSADGSCGLRYSSGVVAAEILGDSTVTTLVCVLRFRVQGLRSKAACVIFKDSVSRDEYRALLVWLRCVSI